MRDEGLSRDVRRNLELIGVLSVLQDVSVCLDDSKTEAAKKMLVQLSGNQAWLFAGCDPDRINLMTILELTKFVSQAIKRVIPDPEQGLAILRPPQFAKPMPVRRERALVTPMRALGNLVTDLAAVPRECSARSKFQGMCQYVNALIRMRSTAHRARVDVGVNDPLPALYQLGNQRCSAVAVYMGTRTRATIERIVPTALAVAMAVDKKNDLYCLRLEVRKQPSSLPPDSFERLGQRQNCAIKLTIVAIPEGHQHTFFQPDSFDLTNNDTASVANVIAKRLVRKTRITQGNLSTFEGDQGFLESLKNAQLDKFLQEISKNDLHRFLPADKSFVAPAGWILKP